jgi:hypothetical protein
MKIKIKKIYKNKTKKIEKIILKKTRSILLNEIVLEVFQNLCKKILLNGFVAIKGYKEYMLLSSFFS